MGQQCPRLHSWISINPQLKGLSGYANYKQIPRLQQSCSLVSILAIQPDLLDLISCFQLPPQEENNKTMIYLSDIVACREKSFRFLYVPPNKDENESIQYLSDFIRDLSEVVISDINNIGLTKIKGKEVSANRKYVLVNGRDIYRAQFTAQQIELVKKIEKSFLETVYQHFETEQQVRSVELDLLSQSLKKHESDWQLLVGAERSWMQLGLSTIDYYRAQSWLRSKCQKFSQMRNNNQMLSSIEIELIRQDIISNCSGNSSLQMASVRKVAQQIVKDIEEESRSKILEWLLEMQKKFISQYSSTPRQIVNKRQSIIQTLKLMGITAQIAPFVTFPIERLELQQEKTVLMQEINHLNGLIEQYQEKIKQKNSQLQDYKYEIQQYCSKFVHLVEIQKKFVQIVAELQKLKNKNDSLSSELEAHLFLEKKYESLKKELQEKLKNQERDNKGMLECLKELTQESLSLHTKLDQQRSQIFELKEQIRGNTEIELRALRSVQNEAEIKTRLNRYQNYVSELKYSIKSFKKFESQKFNHILQHNYKHYKALKEELTEVTKELKKQKCLNQQLCESLQRQKTRMVYFQKFIRNNYQNEPIPECSEENSATDRDSQVALE